MLRLRVSCVNSRRMSREHYRKRNISQTQHFTNAFAGLIDDIKK